MNTPSHFLITVALRRWLGWAEVPRSAAWIGSVAPDIALYFLTFGALYYYQSVLGWSRGETFQHIFGTLYFENPYWKFSHSLLHSPVSLGILFLINYLGKDYYPKIYNWIKWFLLACFFHTAIDIATHYDDGPLILFPFEWDTRFYSPISYWDRQHYGREFSVFEFWLNIGLLVYLLVPTALWVFEKIQGKFFQQD